MMHVIRLAGLMTTTSFLLIHHGRTHANINTQHAQQGQTGTQGELREHQVTGMKPS